MGMSDAGLENLAPVILEISIAFLNITFLDFYVARPSVSARLLQGENMRY